MPALAEPTHTPDRPPRWPQVALLAGGVLMLHAGALRVFTTPPPPGTSAMTPPALQVRQIVPTASAQAQPAAATANATRTATQVGAAEPALASRAAASVVPPDADGRPDAVPGPSGQSPAPSLPAAAPGNPVPTYATQPSPPVTLVYEMHRGGRTGRAELRWRPDAGRYELALDASDFGPQAPGSTSVGSFDAAGLAPQRHVDRRRGRDQRAVNFQRDGGFISFSGPQLTHTLQPGAQDRLSWMLQLPAVLQANPALAAPGAQISLWVASARDDFDVWNFTVQGSEALDLPAGRVEAALRLLRRPQRPYDTEVEVWLDPARQHLVVQLLLAPRPGGGATELRLLDMSLP
jgi:Protein of unknown function (DUF3108)